MRKAIRETYGSISRDRIATVHGLKIEHIVRLVFVVGRCCNDTFEAMIDIENMKYKDMLKVDVVDSYQNLTRKLLHAFKWINLYCKDVTYVLKADEDVFVNIGMLLKQLNFEKPYHKGNIFGHIFDTDEHLEVKRTKTKWGVNLMEYPLDRYPPYAQGTSYTLTKNLIPKIVATSQLLPYLHIEDVFITGIVASKIHGARLVHLKGTSNWGDRKPVPCQFVDTGRIAQTTMTSRLMYATWEALQSYNDTCRATVQPNVTLNL
ncbi:beta-1,3-galactosyltransferase 5-like [Mercenaria mercenaria]|uniref:beta-1,3-galactosyltransferase 5-like n=1 Tax=Mercenaria mercenaria TaxID=6596 RepID=UPI00234ED502|nr:beta-1,3-galactosyltransferase 5-like [Mercenaria mercenaria]